MLRGQLSASKWENRVEVVAFVIRDYVAVVTVTDAAAGVTVDTVAVVTVVEVDGSLEDGRAAADAASDLGVI